MVRGLWYCASKKYAELAGVETHKKLGASFSLATLNPPGTSLSRAARTNADRK